MGEGLETNTFNIPEEEPLDGCKFIPFPYFLLGDNIFSIKKWLIKPYPGKNRSEEQQFIIIASLVLDVSQKMPSTF